MKFWTFAIALNASIFFFGCSSPFSQKPSSSTPSQTASVPDTSTLQTAVKELQMLQTKVGSGITPKAYSELITQTVPVIQQISGEAEAATAAKSAFTGHQLALEYWQCSRLEGYEKSLQCRKKALSAIFAKYPDIEAQAKLSVNSKDIATISTELDEEKILQAIWEKTSADTEVAGQAFSLNSPQQETQL